jgi:hypothetical protein
VHVGGKSPGNLLEAIRHFLRRTGRFLVDQAIQRTEFCSRWHIAPTLKDNNGNRLEPARTSVALVTEAHEGWYKDPFGVREARWFSDGTPTGLVRDGETEMSDPPPKTEYEGALAPLEGLGAQGASDLLRADQAEAQPIPDMATLTQAGVDAQFDSLISPWGTCRIKEWLSRRRGGDHSAR